MNVTIGEAIGLVDRLKPNMYPTELKVKWLSKLDGMIFREILSRREALASQTTFDGYLDDTPQDTELLVQEPYDEEIYNNYLQAMIDRENGEIGKYSQDIALYNTAFTRYRNWVNQGCQAGGASRFVF